MEHMDLTLAKSMRELKGVITTKVKAQGNDVDFGPHCWTGTAVHANSRPRNVHSDKASLNGGYDLVMSVGNFDDCWLLIEELRVRIRMRPGDFLFLRSSLLKHGVCQEWKGTGRFVIVPFCDRALYAYHHVARPLSLRRVYGGQWSAIRNAYPAVDLHAQLM